MNRRANGSQGSPGAFGLARNMVFTPRNCPVLLVMAAAAWLWHMHLAVRTYLSGPS